MLKKILYELKKDKITLRDITILSPYNFQKSVVANIDKRQFQIFNLSISPQNFIHRHSITFSTIQSFKGLENLFIIMTDISRLSDEEYKSLLYVGMSRAKHALYILLNSRLKNDYKKLIKKRLKI